MLEVSDQLVTEMLAEYTQLKLTTAKRNLSWSIQLTEHDELFISLLCVIE